MSNDNQDYDVDDAKALKDLNENDLIDLNKKILQAHENNNNKSSNDMTSQGMQIASEIIASPVVGGLMGYLIDMALNTKPAALITMIILGIFVGFYRAYKLSQ